MATPRALDPEYLRQLLDPEFGGDPATPRDELARRLTARNRLLGNDTVVTTKHVTAAICRWRQAWLDSGFDVSPATRPSRQLVRLLVENSGHKIADQHHMHPLVKNLRYIDRLRQGLPVPSNRIATARKMEAALFVEKRVFDVDANGKPFIRDARPDELDENGHLIEIVCASQERPPAEGTEDARPS